MNLTHAADECVFILQYHESLPTCRHDFINPDFLRRDPLMLLDRPHVGCNETWDGSFTVTMDMKFLKSAVPFIDPKALLEKSSTSLTGVVLAFDGAGTVTTHQSTAETHFSDCQLKSLAASLPGDTDEGKFVRALAGEFVSEGSRTIDDLKDSLVSIPFNGAPPGFALPEVHGELVKRMTKAFEHVGDLCASRRPKSTEPF